MLVKDYVTIAEKTLLPTGNAFKDLTHFVSALAEESGEACGILKRHCRGDFNFFTSTEEQTKMIKELGDILWYINAVAVLLGYTLEDVMKMNNEKLMARLEAGTIKGRGDDR